MSAGRLGLATGRAARDRARWSVALWALPRSSVREERGRRLPPRWSSRNFELDRKPRRVRSDPGQPAQPALDSGSVVNTGRANAQKPAVGAAPLQRLSPEARAARGVARLALAKRRSTAAPRDAMAILPALASLPAGRLERKAANRMEALTPRKPERAASSPTLAPAPRRTPRARVES